MVKHKNVLWNDLPEQHGIEIPLHGLVLGEP